MKLLITGSSGFLGTNLIEYLKPDLSISIIELDRNKLRNINSDVFKSVDVVIHLAGKAHDLKNAVEPQDYYDVNFDITKQLFDNFLSSGAQKFIFISSVKAVADSIEGILTEEVRPNPQTHYGKSKLMAEEYIKSQRLPKGKFFYILRPCMIHGKGNKGNLNLLYNFVNKGFPYPLASFQNKRSFLSVENLCFIIKRFITNDSVLSGVFNIADDDALSTNDVIRIMGESLNKNVVFWSIPRIFIRALAYIGGQLKLPLTTERLDKLTENYVVSNARVKKVLSINLPITSREGIKQTTLSFRS